MIDQEEFLSDDGDFTDRKRNRNKIINHMVELWNDNNLENSEHANIVPQNLSPDFIEELDEEYEAEYKAINIPERVNIDLVHMDQLQKAYNYNDKYPLLSIRKQVLIFIKTISVLAQQISKHPLFEAITLAVIISNSILLSLQLNEEEALDLVFLTLYYIEAFIKILGKGFLFNQGAYLRDFWNIIDALVIVAGSLQYFMSNSVKLSALRSLRVLRPLKAISSIQSLKQIMTTLFLSFNELGNALLVLVFTYTIFAIIGLQLFSGYTKYRCFDINGIESLQHDYCQDCPSDYICGKMLYDPKQGYLNFDNFGLSILQVFIVSNLDGWVAIMSAIIYTFSSVAVIYFVSLIIVSTYFLINLTLAILKVNFNASNDHQDIAIEETSYNYRQLKKLNIYKPKLDTKRRQNFHRQQSMRRSRVVRSLQPKQPTYIENSEIQQPKKMKLPFKPLLINQYSKPKTFTHRNTQITMHGIYGVKVDEGKQKPIDTLLQVAQLQRRATQRNLLQRGTSFHENPLLELDLMLQKERNPRQTLAQNKLVKDVKLITQSFQKPPSLMSTVKSAVRKSRMEQEEEKDKSSLSVTLTELGSICNENLKERFQELDIEFEEQQEIVRKEPVAPTQIYIKKKKQQQSDLQKQNAITKDEEKLQIRLHGAQLQPRVLYFEYFSSSISDVLPSKEKQKQLLEQKRREEKIKNLKFKINYQLFFTEKIDKILKKKERKPTYDSSKESQNLNIRVFPDPAIRQQQSIFAGKTDVIPRSPARSPSSWQGQKNKGKSYFRPHFFQYPVLGYNEYKDLFKQEELKQTKFQEEVEIKEAEITIPKEDQFHHYKFYQLYHAQRIKDIENVTGVLEAESSLLDVKAVDFDPYMQNKFEIIISALNYTTQAYTIYMRGLMGILILSRNKLEYLVNSNTFEYLINISVLANTIVLGLDGLVTQNQTLDELNIFFTLLFALEQILKIFSFGVNRYCKDAMNLFDLLIVLISLIDLLFFSTGSGARLQAFRSLRLFRAFRIFRVTKLVRSLAYTNFLIQILSNAFYSLLYIILLLFLFIYIFTLLGISFFQGAITDTIFRTSFDTFLDSLLVVSQILILQWVDVLYELLYSNSNNGLVLSYVLIWIFIGNYVLLNLLMASLLNHFDDEFKQQAFPDNNKPTIQMDQIVEASPEFQLFQKEKSAYSNSNSSNDMRMSTIRTAFTYNYDFKKSKNSLYLFNESNQFRIFCQRLTNNRIFTLIILFTISFSTIKLILDTYYSDLLPALDIIVTVIFLIEFLLKVVAQGFIMEPNTYMRNTWNLLDFCIIVFSLIDVSYGDTKFGFVKVLRLLRTLRPLRLLKEHKQIKLLITTLLNSFSGVSNVTIIIFLVFVMFGILGISLFQRKMQYCNIVTNLEFNYYNETECLFQGGQWSNRDMNFDNILTALLTLFILSKRDDWDRQIYWYIDAGDDGPSKDAQLWVIIYFLAFILIGSILLMDLFTGVIFVNYKFADYSLKDKIVSQGQEDWINIQKMILDSNPNFALYYPPDNYLRSKVFYFVSNKYFDAMIILIIIANVIVLSLSYDEASSNYNSNLETLNLCFNLIFVSEAILKLIAYGLNGYFRNNWNQFDFLVVLTSILDIIMKLSGAVYTNSFLSSGPQLFRVFRVLRVTKLFRLVKSLKGLKKLIDTATFALPELFEVIILMLLMYCIFAILAVFLYQDVTEGIIIDDTYNFRNFHHALLTLFRCTTGEQQYQIIFDIMKSQGSIHCLFFIVFSIVMQRIILNLFILIVIEQYEKFYINSDNPLQRFKEYESDFIEGWAPLAKPSRGNYITVKSLINLILSIKSPLGYDLNEKIQLALEDWKKYNQDTKQNIQNIERIKNIVTIDSKKKAATIIMMMEMTATDEGYLEYHYVLFTIMKMFQQNFMINSTNEGRQKVKQTEEQSLIKIRKNRIYIHGVNPCVQYLYVMMCFKAIKRFAEKVAERAEEKKQEFSEVSSDSYYCYSSSEIGQREPPSIISNTSRESYNQFCSPPDVTAYQSELNINSNKNSIVQIINRQPFSSSQNSEMNSPYYESPKRS